MPSKFYGYPFDVVNALEEALDWLEDDGINELTREEYLDAFDALSDAQGVVNAMIERRVKAEKS